MRTLLHRLRWPLLILAVFLSIGLPWWFLADSDHSRLGRVREAHAVDSPQTWHRWRDVLNGRLPLRSVRWREIAGGGDDNLDIDSNRLEWSQRSDKTGYLYFQNGPAWEFAPCKLKQLGQLAEGDVRCEFYGAKNPMGAKVFGADWRTNAVIIYDDQIMLVRLVRTPRIVYVLKFQHRDQTHLRVQYLEMSVLPH